MTYDLLANIDTIKEVIDEAEDFLEDSEMLMSVQHILVLKPKLFLEQLLKLLADTFIASHLAPQTREPIRWCSLRH